MTKNMPYLLIVILIGTLIFACGRCACRQNKHTHPAINITISQDSLQIAFDLIFDVFGNTDFDDLIEPAIAPLSSADWKLGDEKMAARMQYREGYIETMKRGILNIPSEYFINLLRNKDENIADYLPDKDTLHFARKASLYYAAGALNASEKKKLFSRQLWNDVTKTKRKYYEDDMNMYFRYGKTVPPNELKKRIEETPYLQAVIFLQDRLKNTPVVSLSNRLSDFPNLETSVEN